MPVRKTHPTPVMNETVNPEKHRPIRSFVLRQGRMSVAQTRALETLLPRHGIPYREQVLDLDTTFGRSAPKILEIGFGMGDSTAAIAAAHPQNDYLGIEVHGPGVGSLLNQIAALGLTNLRVIQHDAVEVLKHMIAPASLDGVHIFFPDPWHKKKHHKRRLIQPELVALLCEKLKPGGYLHAATDWQEYAEHILAVLAAEPRLANTAADYAPKPDYRPLTKFEHRGIKLGHGVWDIVFRRI
jgi:tRNA (guanine-N7-)-methyltransferase